MDPEDAMPVECQVCHEPADLNALTPCDGCGDMMCRDCEGGNAAQRLCPVCDDDTHDEALAAARSKAREDGKGGE